LNPDWVTFDRLDFELGLTREVGHKLTVPTAWTRWLAGLSEYWRDACGTIYARLTSAPDTTYRLGEHGWVRLRKVAA